MAQIAIYDKSGNYKLNSHGDRVYGKMKYVGQTVNISYLEFTIASPYPIAWNVGDYVDWGAGLIGATNLRFMLFSIPQPKKEAERGLYGGGFVYSGVQFHDYGQILSLVPFVDMEVENDNLIHYSTRSGLSTFEPVAGILARLQACADAYRLSLAATNPMKGVKFYFWLCTSDAYSYERTVTPITTLGGENAEAYEELIAEARAVTIDGFVLDGLNNIQEVWPAVGWSMVFVPCTWNYDYDEHGRISEAEEQETGIYYTFSYRSASSTVPSSIKDEYGQECESLPTWIVVVNVGGVNFVSNAGVSAQFARHAGLVNLRKYITNQEDFLTRLVAYGSERNLPGRYYNGKEILNADSVDIPNLMIPISKWGKTYGRVHDSTYNIEYETTLNDDGSIATATARYNSTTYVYTYNYNSSLLTYTVTDKTGAVVASGSYTTSSFPTTSVLPQTYKENLMMLPDARKAFIEDADIIAKYGVITKTVRFDNDKDGNIYPSITGATLQDIIDDIGLSKQIPTSTNPTTNLIVKQVGDDWVSDIYGMDADILAQIKADPSYRVLLLRYGYARRGQWFPSKDNTSVIRQQNPRPDKESTHTTRRYPNPTVTHTLRECEPSNYQLVRRGYSNGLPALRYRIIGWDILTHGSMPSHSQLTYATSTGRKYDGATLATRLGAALKMPKIMDNNIYTHRQSGVTYYLDSKKEGVTDLYIGLYHYEKDRGWELVSNIVKVRGRLPIPGYTSRFDCTKVWFGNTDNIILGG